MAPVPPASAAVASVFPTRLAFVFHRGARVGWVLADVLGDRAVAPLLWQFGTGRSSRRRIRTSRSPSFPMPVSFERFAWPRSVMPTKTTTRCGTRRLRTVTLSCRKQLLPSSSSSSWSFCCGARASLAPLRDASAVALAAARDSLVSDRLPAPLLNSKP